MIRLAIYDDNQQRRESLETLLTLNPEIEWVGSFPDCSDVLAEMESLHPDLVLMDIGMPYVNGIEGVGLIKGRFPNIKVIMQTVFEKKKRYLPPCKQEQMGTFSRTQVQKSFFKV